MKQREQEIEASERERETSAQQLDEHSNEHTALGQKGRRERKNKMRRDSVLCACMMAFIKICFLFLNH